MQQQTTICWKGVEEESMEVLTITPSNGYMVHGNIVGVEEGIPYHLDYAIDVDERWQVRSLSLRVQSRTLREFLFTKKDGKWINEKGEVLTQFNNCIDIDISLTPFTNTLPINRLQWQVNEPQKIRVLYCKMPEGGISVMEQQYTYLGNHLYLYENADGAYSNVLMVDESGIPLHYPGRGSRVGLK